MLKFHGKVAVLQLTTFTARIVQTVAASPDQINVSRDVRSFDICNVSRGYPIFSNVDMFVHEHESTMVRVHTEQTNALVLT